MICPTRIYNVIGVSTSPIFENPEGLYSLLALSEK
jgi:hypothetical protein